MGAVAAYGNNRSFAVAALCQLSDRPVIAHCITEAARATKRWLRTFTLTPERAPAAVAIDGATLRIKVDAPLSFMRVAGQ